MLVASVKSAKIVICVGFLYDISFVDVFVGFGDYEKTISMPTKNRRFHKYNINLASATSCSMNRYLYIQEFGICLLSRNISFVTNEEYLYCLMQGKLFVKDVGSDIPVSLDTIHKQIYYIISNQQYGYSYSSLIQK